jgi:hypothetical protein
MMMSYQAKGEIFLSLKIETSFYSVSVDLRVSRIYRISIVWRAGSWRRRHATSKLAALQTMEMPLDGDNTKDS